MDVTSELNINDTLHYQYLIGDMASCAVFPREGNLEILCILFAHLKKHHSADMVFDLSKTSDNNSDVERKDSSYSEFSSTIKRKIELHPKTLTPRCVRFTIASKVDECHAGDVIVRR